MIRELIKGNVHIAHLEAKNGFYSHNMYTKGLSIRTENGDLYIVVDITKNLRVKNKHQNDYEDTIDFISYMDQFSVLTFTQEHFKLLPKLVTDTSKIYVEFIYNLKGDRRSFLVGISIDSQFIVFKRSFY